MRRITVKELLTSPEYASLQFFINPEEISNFINNKKDVLRVQQEISDKCSENALERFNNADTRLFMGTRADCMATRENSQIIYDVLIKNSNKIDINKFIIFLGNLALHYLTTINNKYNYEYCYANGDIVCLENGKIGILRENPNNHEGINKDYIEAKERLAEGILVASRYLSQFKGKENEYEGIIAQRGKNSENIIIDFSSDTIKKFAIISAIAGISPDKLKLYIDKKLISKGAIINEIKKKDLLKGYVILLVAGGVLNNEDIKSIYGINLTEFLKNPEIDMCTKIFLYNRNIINIKELEEYVKLNQDEIQSIKDEAVEMLKGNIDKITELLIHNVLDYENSMNYLDELEQKQIITAQERTEIEQTMNDFKTAELLNDADKPKFLEAVPTGTIPPSHRVGIAIDPQLRVQYLKSIGDVKELKIRAQKEEGKSEALEGYELLILPSKKVAILEKFYENTRDREGNIRYKKDKQGKAIPAIDNATYVLPLIMAKELVEKQNKQDLLKSPYVHRAFHTVNWVNSVENKIMEINPRAEFIQENTDNWKKAIADNYRANHQDKVETEQKEER